MSASRIVSRLLSRSQPSISVKFFNGKPANALNSSSFPSVKRVSATSRLPVEMSCLVGSLMPLHSAIATARLTSALSLESQSWGLVPTALSPCNFRRYFHHGSSGKSLSVLEYGSKVAYTRPPYLTIGGSLCGTDVMLLLY